MNPHPDQKYIDALKNNDNLLIQEIYQKWYADVEKYVLQNSGTPDQARTLFQEAITTLWEKVKLTDIQLTSSFGAYFYPFYRFKWLNYLSRDKTRENVDTSIEINDIDQYIDTVIDFFNEDDDQNLKERRLFVFSECFIKLGEDCQKMLNLKFKGKRAEEIRKITGKPSLNSVYVAMHGCREQLKKLIEKDSRFNTLKL